MKPVAAAVIHLARRPDRARDFELCWKEAGLGIPLTVWNAVDEPAAPAAGCFYSHLSLLFAHPAGPLLVLEDDVVFGAGFAAQLTALNPPPGWDLIYLGGDHLTRPAPAGPGLVRPGVMRGAHAYLVRDPQHLAWELARRLPPVIATRDRAQLHIDAALSLLASVTRYATDPLLATQSGSPSDITGLRYRYPPRHPAAVRPVVPPRTTMMGQPARR